MSPMSGRLRFPPCVLLALALLPACTARTPDSFDGTVELFFRPEVGVHYFHCDEAYSVGKVSLHAVDFRFYVFDVRLVTADGSEHAVALEDAPPFQEADLALLDFEDGMGNCVGSSTLNKTIRGTVVDWQETGRVEYTGVRFRLGLPPGGARPEWVDGLGTGAAFFAAWSTANFGVMLGDSECAAGCAGPGRPEIALDGFDVETSTIVVDWGVLVDPLANTGCTPTAACGCDSPCVPGRALHWADRDGGDEGAVFHVE